MHPYEYKAQYYETDQMGIIHHSNYIRWLESARIDYLEQLGISYRGLEERGIISPVVTVEGRYRSMVRFGETVRIEVKIEKYNGVKLEFSYRITDRESGELRFTGASSHCFVDRAGKIVALKRELPEIHSLLEAKAGEEREEK